jgi:hypothetical protein
LKDIPNEIHPPLYFDFFPCPDKKERQNKSPTAKPNITTYCGHQTLYTLQFQQLLLTAITKFVNIIKINTYFRATAASIIRVKEQA